MSGRTQRDVLPRVWPPALWVLLATVLVLLATALVPVPAASDDAPAPGGDDPAGEPVGLALWLGERPIHDDPDGQHVALSRAIDARSEGRELAGAVLDAQGRVVEQAGGFEVAILVEPAADTPDDPTGSLLLAGSPRDEQPWDGIDGVVVDNGRLLFDPPVVLRAGDLGVVTLRARATGGGQELADAELPVQVTGPVDPTSVVTVRVRQGPGAPEGVGSLIEVSGLVAEQGPAGPALADDRVGGLDAELFDAGADITRGELAALLVRLLQAGGEVSSPLAGEPTEGLAALSDVGPGHPYATEIAVVRRLDLMRSLVDDTFRPEDRVPRQQAASFLVRTLRELQVELGSGSGPSFDDLDEAPLLHQGSIEVLVATGILPPGGTFRPREVLRRGEFVGWQMAVLDLLTDERGGIAGWDVLPGFVADGTVERGTARVMVEQPGPSAQGVSVFDHGLLVGGRLIPGVTRTIGHPVGAADQVVRPGPGIAPVRVPSRPLGPACSEAPADRFVDVSGVHAPGVDCVGWWQVAQGRTTAEGDTFGPDDPVTRAQMASFVARALEASGGQLPEDPPATFGDTVGSVHALAIDQLAALGVVGGTAEGVYDPGGTVTRAQMGSFLARAFEVRTGRSMPIGPVAFDDLREGATHTDNVLRLASAGLTGGVAEGVYDPSGTVTRGQMGTFLARLLALLVVEGAAPAAPA